MEFTKLQTTKLGTLAENLIINEFSTKKGYIPTTPSIDGPHLIDAICFNGETIFGLDVKCKSSRTYFPDTGCDTADILKYNQYPFPVYLLWVDPKTGEIYGNWLKKLDKHKKIEGKYCYFPLDKMVKFRDLTEKEIKELKQLENSNYNGR